MKTLISGVLLMALSMLSYPQSALATCAFPVETESMLISQLNSCLPKGIWESKSSTAEKNALHFYESGQVHWFTFTSDEQMALNTYDWKVVNDANGHSMLLFTNESEQHYFEVEVACSSLALTETSCGSIRLDLQYENALPKAAYSQQQNMLEGQWGNTITPVKVKVSSDQQTEQVYLKYRFLPNGAFVRLLGSDKLSIRDTGHWMLAKDGKHLILQFDNGKMAVSSLKYISMDELVLQHMLQSPNEHFIANRKDFFFNKS